MELATIEMPRAEARKAYLEYRSAIRKQQTKELDEVRSRQLAQDRAIATGYRQLSVGRQLIRLSTSIHAGGFDDVGRPRLAIARCDFAEVEMRRQGSGEVTYREWKPGGWNGTWNRDQSTSESRLILLQLPAPEDRQARSAIATVPPIPPQFRPNAHARNFHILFDATWRQPTRSRRSRAPRDPALLKQLSGDLYAVLAVWDLTEVERAALDAGVVR